MKRYVLPIVLVLALALAGGAYLLPWNTTPTEPAPHVEAPTPAVAAPAVAAAPPRAASARGAEPPPDDAPAWLRSQPDPTQSLAEPTPSASDRAAAAEQDRIERMQAVMTKFQRLQSAPQPQPREILAAIQELETINGSPVVGGVRLDVLRSNVLVIEKMQALSSEVRRLQGPSGTPSPQNLALVQARMAEMEALRSQLRSDVMQPGAPRP